MEHVRDEIRIEAPVDRVWPFLCDTSRWHDWAPRMETSDWSGPYDRVGTTYVSKFRMTGFPSKQTCTVVEVEPLRLIHEHTDDGPMDTFFRFEPEGDTTRLATSPDEHARLVRRWAVEVSAAWPRRSCSVSAVGFRSSTRPESDEPRTPGPRRIPATENGRRSTPAVRQWRTGCESQRSPA